MNDLLNLELRIDILKMFDQAWAETLMVMDTEPTMAFWKVFTIDQRKVDSHG